MQRSVTDTQVTACCGSGNYTSVVSETGDRAFWFCMNCKGCTDLVNTNDLARLERLALELQTERKIKIFELQELSLPVEVVDREFSYKILELNRVIRIIVETRRRTYGKV